MPVDLRESSMPLYDRFYDPQIVLLFCKEICTTRTLADLPIYWISRQSKLPKASVQCWFPLTTVQGAESHSRTIIKRQLCTHELVKPEFPTGYVFVRVSPTFILTPLEAHI